MFRRCSACSAHKKVSKMRKLQENPNAKLRSVQGLMAETNLSRYHIMQIAEEAAAVVRFEKHGVRIDAERFWKYLRNNHYNATP